MLNTSTELTAKITLITSSGAMTVKFNKAVLVPQNYTSFNSTNLKLIVKPSPVSDITKLNFDWNLTYFTETEMQFKLFFDNPIDVSSNNVILLRFNNFVHID